MVNSCHCFSVVVMKLSTKFVGTPIDLLERGGDFYSCHGALRWVAGIAAFVKVNFRRANVNERLDCLG